MIAVVVAALVAGACQDDQIPTMRSEAAEGPAASGARARIAKTWEHGIPAWAATVTKGGAGGEVIRVTSLASEGPGTLRAALEADGPRVIVFEVGGIIDLDRRTITIRNPNVTVAGQTAPSPGISLIRGGIDVATHDVILQHLRIRPGDAGAARASGWEEDSISTVSASNLVVDHCSLTWGTDENLSASGPRFTGNTPDDWRQGTSHNIVYSHNLIAEGLADSSHAKFEHSKGSLIHDNVSRITLFANLYAHNYERNPLFKGGVRGSIVNNFIYNPGERAIHYNLQPLEWGDTPPETGQMNVIGNVMRGGLSTAPALPFIMIGGSGDLDLHQRDNLAVDKWGSPLPMFGRYTTSAAAIRETPVPMELPAGVEAIPAQQVEHYVLSNAGARPWDRDRHDVRILADVTEGRGKIIDSQDEVGGYPAVAETRRVFNPDDWDHQTWAPVVPAALDAGAKSKGT